MRRDLGIQGLGDLVALPLCATLATYRRDGSVLLSPVWHEWRDGGFNVMTDEDDVKARHLRRDPRASIALYDNDPPYRGIELRGVGRLVSEGASETAHRITARYLNADDAKEYSSQASEGTIIIRLEPGELRTWDFADDF